MRKVMKKYYIQETELCILLALKGEKMLYGICLDNAEAMTQEELYYKLFIMQKKGIISRNASFGAFLIEEGLDCCLERIRTADRFIVLADADELVPEKYFYTAHEGAVMLEPAGQYDAAQQEGAFHMEPVTAETVQDIIRADGFGTGTTDTSVPAEILTSAQDFWQEDKNMILRHSAVKKLLQEYDVHSRCKKKQCVRFVCGLDTYLVCSDGNDVDGMEGGKQSWC